jgi:HlyD family secretion protein
MAVTLKRPRKYTILGGLLCIGAAVFFLLPSKKSGDADKSPLTFTAVKGPLTISVSESGTIKSRNLEIIKSELEGQTTILFLVPEGTQVKKGDLLVELDASKLQDQRIDKQITEQNAEANFIRARESLEVAKNQAQADIAKAELDYQFAKEDLQKYERGDYPMAVKEAEAKLSLSQNELARAAEKLKQSTELYAESFTSLSEVQADELSKKRADLDLVVVTEQLKLLKDFTYKRRITELKSNEEQTRLALERVKRKASADLVQGAAELKAKESEYERQKAQLAKIVSQIQRTKLYAPTNGLVVYATTGQNAGRMNAEPLAEGANVRERQDLIYLPTTASVMAEVKVHESSLDKVRPGLPVRVTVDALPGKSFVGVVAKIAPLPDAQSAWMNPDLKVYNTEIHLDGNSEDLRTGMSCRAEIIAEQHAEAVYVPVQAILRVSGKPTVYVVEKDKPVERREITLGLDNNRMAHVISGLNPGELVQLNPPLSEASAPAEVIDPALANKPGPKVPDAKPPVNVPPTGEGRTGRSRGAEGEVSPRAEGTRPEGGRGGEGRRGQSNLTPEQREERRKQFENMSPEDREKMRQQFMQRKSQSGDAQPKTDGADKQ